MKTLKKINLRETDTVHVLTGKDRGKQGRIIKVDREKGKVTVENVMMATKHVKKASRQKGQTGVTKLPQPIDASNVQLVCPRCSKPTGIMREEVKGKRVRKCKTCKEYIDQV